MNYKGIITSFAAFFTMSIYFDLVSMKDDNKFKDLITESLEIDNIPSNIQEELKLFLERDGIQDHTNIDEFEFIYILELKYKITDLISAHTGFTLSNSAHAMLMHWFTSILITSHNNEEAIHKWKNLKKYKNIQYLSSYMEDVLNIEEDKIITLYILTQKYVDSSMHGIISDLMSRLHDGYGHSWNDAYEINQRAHPTRSLANLQDKGMRVKFDPAKVSCLVRMLNDFPGCCLVEKMKNERFLTINGFRNSKIALALHDFFDHFWTFSLLERAQILERYKDFLQSVGNPHLTDIFSREGELIASIAFDFRFVEFSPKLHSLLTYEQILKLFTQHLTTENQQLTYNLLKSEYNNVDFREKLERVFSGIFIELMEQRRKHGFIRKLDKNYNICGTLNALDMEYVSLIVEVFNFLYQQKEKAREILLNIALIMENYLYNTASSNEVPQDLIFTLDAVESFEPSKLNISPQRIEWFKNNLGSISHRKNVC